MIMQSSRVKAFESIAGRAIANMFLAADVLKGSAVELPVLASKIKMWQNAGTVLAE